MAECCSCGGTGEANFNRETGHGSGPCAACDAHKWKPCEACNGEGQVAIGEHYVTRDMAIDACDRSLEGMFHSFSYGPCDECGGRGECPVDEVCVTKEG